MNKDIIVWENVNVRPTNYNRKDFNCGDCTTRALTYSLNFLVIIAHIRKLKMNSIVLLKSQTKQIPIIPIIIIIVIPMVFGIS